MKISVYNSFETARHVWEKIENEGDCYTFQTYKWLYCWYKTIGKSLKIEPCLVEVANGDESPIMLIPLGIQKTTGIIRLVFLDGLVSDYNCPILKNSASEVFDPEYFNEIWEKIKKVLPHFDVVHFEKMPEKIGSKINPFLFLNCRYYKGNSYAALLRGTWESYYKAQIKSSMRSDSKRNRKRLSELGQLQFFIPSDKQDIKAIIDKMIEQKTRWFKETKKFNLFSNDAYIQFYHKAGQELSPTGQVHVSALLVNNAIIATHWGSLYKNRFYLLMPTYEGGEWAKYSAGRLLLEYLLEWCFEQGIEIFDFTVGGERYKRDWCNQEMILYEYLEANSLKGNIYLALNNLKRYIRQNPELYRRIKKIKIFLFKLR